MFLQEELRKLVQKTSLGFWLWHDPNGKLEEEAT
jgi:hypothetical protein